MNWKRFSIVSLAACASAVGLAWAMKTEVQNQHRQARQLILHYTLSRVSNPVIVIGDSIVEASTVPRAICGHPIVNAGLNGASTSSDLGGWLAPALDGKRAAAIIVSLGINDALASAPQSETNFEAHYGALLVLLSKLTTRLAVVEITPVEVQGRMTGEMQDHAIRTIKTYNSILRDLAKRNGAAFIALPALPAPLTIDGVHLNSNGYLAWDDAVMQAAGMACD